MALPFSDDFNRADGGLGANWTTIGTAMSVSSNRAVGSAATSGAFYNVDTPNADCYAQVQFATLPGGTESLSVGVRLNTSTFDGYQAQYLNGTGMRILRIDLGVPTVLATMGSAPTAGQVVKLTASGSTLTLYYDGVSAGSTTDSTYSAAGKSFMGATSSGAGGALDNFETGNLSAVATLSAPTATSVTATAATLGATTDQTSGTFYVVVDTAANLSGVTATQIKAGQKASGSAALAANSAAVSTTTPSAGVTGLTAGTLYSYAAVQNNSNGDSNVVTGTFTTPVLEQTHYRFRNDDGSETTATWAAAEDTPISLAKNTPVRLRVEIGATNDPASAAYKLQYRKVGDSTWRDIN